MLSGNKNPACHVIRQGGCVLYLVAIFLTLSEIFSFPKSLPIIRHFVCSLQNASGQRLQWSLSLHSSFNFSSVSTPHLSPAYGHSVSTPHSRSHSSSTPHPHPVYLILVSFSFEQMLHCWIETNFGDFLFFIFACQMFVLQNEKLLTYEAHPK